MKDLKDLKIGDKVKRYLGCERSVKMNLEVSEILGDRIKCGAWEFDKETGFEIDEEIGWDGKTIFGSWIERKGE